MWVAAGDAFAVGRAFARSSSDGKRHMLHPLFLKAVVCASFTLASAGSGNVVVEPGERDLD